MTNQGKNPLGNNIGIPTKYSPSILYSIPRQKNSIDFLGVDRWDCYEVFWKTKAGLPQMATGVLTYSINSPYIVESKSVKLYLGSFFEEEFESYEQLSKVILSDIGAAVGKTDGVSWEWGPVTGLPCSSVPQCSSIPQCNSENLSFKIFNHDQIELFEFHNFRSICPVTNQPDYASIVLYASSGSVDKVKFFEHLYSYKNHGAFHETCSNEIFSWVMDNFNPLTLGIGCYFTRRGGIAINPIRWIGDQKLDLYLLSIRYLRQ
jgi:7-cyano-7-deazaguanine reductase